MNTSQLDALVGGYHIAFVAGAVFAAAGAALGGTVLRAREQSVAAEALVEAA
jgi:hypothetical protein